MIEQVKSQVSLGVKEKAAMNYQYSKRNLISNPGNHHQSNQKLANQSDLLSKRKKQLILPVIQRSKQISRKKQGEMKERSSTQIQRQAQQVRESILGKNISPSPYRKGHSLIDEHNFWNGAHQQRKSTNLPFSSSGKSHSFSRKSSLERLQPMATPVKKIQINNQDQKEIQENSKVILETLKNRRKQKLGSLQGVSQQIFQNAEPNPQSKLQTKDILEKLGRSFRSRVTASEQSQKQTEIIDKIRQNIVGLNAKYMSPLKIELQSVYVDHTATNRPYKTVENMIKLVKKFAANPHTEFSHFGNFSTLMMHYARDSLLRSFSANLEEYVALPTGSGSTGAIEKAMRIVKSLQTENEKPSIFITPYQHHSNILPWVEFYDSINILSSDTQGNLLMKELEEQLKNSPTNNIFVSISAASNVTSTLTDLKAFNEVIRRVRQNGKSVIFGVDCAAYCCHHQLNLQVFDQIDFAYLSPHKNLGGAEACGVLIARKSIVKDAKPTFPGGGTVTFVKGYTKMDVFYDADIFAREIAGTPPFMGFYRAALSFELLKSHIGYDFIHHREIQNTQRFLKVISEGNARLKHSNAQIIIYGDLDFNKRANVITLNVLAEENLVSYHLISLILSDVFGIQLRSGCFCAGPYGINLLQLDQKKGKVIQQEVSVGILANKPGFVRLDLTFYLELYEIDYIANAILGVAEFHKNIGLLYNVCNDGEIKRHKRFQGRKNYDYSLCSAFCDDQKLLQEERKDRSRLKRREQNLRNQYQRGINILKDTLQFMRQKNSDH